MTTRAKLKAVLCGVLWLAFIPVLSSATPKVLGDFELGKTTTQEALQILKAKPDCKFQEDKELHEIIVFRDSNCYNVPGDPRISLYSRKYSKDGRVDGYAPSNVIEYLRLGSLPTQNCEETYLPMLKETWGEPTGKHVFPDLATYTYWIKNDICIQIVRSARGKGGCSILYFTPQNWLKTLMGETYSRLQKEQQKANREKQKASKPRTQL